MRTVCLTCAVFAGLVAAAFMGLVPTQVRVRAGAVAAADSSAVSAPSREVRAKATSLVFRSEPKVTAADAELEALVRAQLELEKYLRSLDPPVDWRPPLEYIRNTLARGTVRLIDVQLSEENRAILEQAGDITSLKQAEVEFTITPAARREMLYMARQDRSENRLLLLAPLLAGLVLVLLTVGAYIQLDEQTKGYYTGWLRVALLGTITVVAGSGWWWFRHASN